MSSHELGQPDVYRDVVDESAYVRFPLTGEDGGEGGPGAQRVAAALGRPSLDGVALVAWTTTPWTLLSNTGLAVNPELDYVLVGDDIVAASLAEAVFGEGAVPAATIPGADLVGLRYTPPFGDVELPPGQGAAAWRVVPGAFVEADEGTGIVHLAPAFGEVDRQVGQEHGLPALNPVGPDGCFTGAVPWLEGEPVRETNGRVNDRLEAAGLLVRRLSYEHTYPHCWRCGTALIYWGKPSWYIRTSARKDDLVAQNRTVGWHPEHIRDGRMGEWLVNNVDWALSRDRFWGTPLPVWRCEAGHAVCAGSLAELSDLAGRDVTGVDPHRPAIDEVTVPCAECAAAGAPADMRRVEPVIDAWFDSGSMPAAQVGYPHAPGSEEAMRFPADFVVEAIDQTRGWFYSLLAVNDLVLGRAPYRHVMVLGHIVDADGRKMSKSLGNVVDPWDLVGTRGADPLRWWMYSQGSPWTATRVSAAAIDASVRDMLLTLWNTVSFFTTYASLNGFDPADPGIPAPAERGVLDRWARSRVMSTLGAVTAALDGYEPLEAATALGRLVDDLSNWYVRRSRRRFWRTDPDAAPGDALAAQATLYDALIAVSLMLAPFCPFVADRLWRELGASSGEGDSVHLQAWPALDEASVDPGLEAEMALAVQLSSLGRAARSEAGVKVRQPLSRALVFLAPGSPAILADVVADELNVDEVVEAEDLAEAVSLEIVPNFRLLGPRLGEAVKEVRAGLARLDAPRAAAALEAGETVTVELSGGPVTLGPGELEVRVRGQAGFAVSRQGSAVVALDLTIDDDLRRRGLVREVVRHVQDLRKARGLEVSDRIRLWLTVVDPALFEAIGREVLAVEVAEGPGGGQAVALDVDGDGAAPVDAWLEKA